MLDLIIAIDDEGLVINTHSHIQIISGVMSYANYDLLRE